MWFDDAVPGEERAAESSARYNAVNELLRSTVPQGYGFPAEYTGTSVEICNVSDETIPRFTAVSLLSPRELDRDALAARFSGLLRMNVIPARDSVYPWAVAQEEVPPGGFGRAAVSGITPAYFSGSGRYVSPSSAGLCAGSGGAAEVLAPGYHSDGGSYPGLIVMSGVDTRDYRGIFKLCALSGHSLMIAHGADLQYPYCGYTDVPGCEFIPRTVLEITAAGAQTVSLQFFYDAAGGGYSASFHAGATPAGAVFGVVLGTFNAGTTVQIRRFTDDLLVFGNDWYLR